MTSSSLLDDLDVDPYLLEDFVISMSFNKQVFNILNIWILFIIAY